MICFAGVGFIRQNTLCVTAFSHGSKPVGSRQHGQGGNEFYPRPLFIKPSKTLFALRAFVAFIDPARIVIGPKGNRRRRIGGRMFGAVLWRRSIWVRGRAALSIKGGGNNGGLGLFHLQPVTLYLVTDPGT